MEEEFDVNVESDQIWLLLFFFNYSAVIYIYIYITILKRWLLLENKNVCFLFYLILREEHE